MRIVILGPHISGIGTQAALLAKKLRIPAFSPGDILRNAVRERTFVGEIAQRELDNGGLLDDDTVLALVIERLSYSDSKKGFILHGFPETVRQAIALDETLRQNRRHLDAVIELSPIAEDPKQEAIPDHRRPVNIAPVANYYWNQQRLIVIEGPKDYGAISAEIYRVLALEDIV